MKQVHKIYHRKHRTIYATYETKWEKFKPPFWWCFKWAYKLIYLSTVSDKHAKHINIKQVQKGGNSRHQVQIGIVNNYSNDMEEK